MKHNALQILHRLREFALEKEEMKLADRQRDEVNKLRDCHNSLAEVEFSYQHTVENAKASDWLRRDQCVREAGNRHITDLRQLKLAQQARDSQVAFTLQAKQRADMIKKVIENRQADDQAVADRFDRRQMDDVAQNLFVFHQNNKI